MRLIDADEALNAMCGHYWGDGRDKELAIDIVKHQPTVDAVPVVHAHWYCYDRDEYDVRCSNCDNEAPYGMDTNDVFKNLEFCPSCGAKMDDDEAKEYLKWV